MTNPIEPTGRHLVPRLSRGLPKLSGRSLVRGLAALAAWARLAPASPHFGGADGRPVLDPQRRAVLWPVLVETVSVIAMPATQDGSPEAGLAGLASLADCIRDHVAAAPPRPAVLLGGADPPQLFVLQILASDLQPCLGRWQSRLAAWCQGGRLIGDWPLLGLCRGDLERTRLRLVERAWQLGMALDLAGLEKLLPARGAAPPELSAAAEIEAAEASAVSRDPAALAAGWRIYVEAAGRLPAGDWPTGSGALGEAIAALDGLAAETRVALKATPPAALPTGGADTIQALALALLTEALQPFLAEWRPRWQRFAVSGRPEAKWRRCEDCRAALAATRDRCRPIIEKLGREIGVPSLSGSAGRGAPDEETPLQLPPPPARS